MMIDLNTITEAVRIQFPSYVGPINIDTTSKDIPGWDSVAHVQLMLLIEELGGVEIDISATIAAKNVGDLLAVCSGRVEIKGEK